MPESLREQRPELNYECAILISYLLDVDDVDDFSGLTTQPQRPGARDATMATATLPPGSLQRRVRPRYHKSRSLMSGRYSLSKALVDPPMRFRKGTKPSENRRRTNSTKYAAVNPRSHRDA